jgi:hypothetical protein
MDAKVESRFVFRTFCFYTKLNPREFEKLLFGLVLAVLGDNQLLSSAQIACARFLHVPQKLAIDLQMMRNIKTLISTTIC